MKHNIFTFAAILVIGVGLFSCKDENPDSSSIFFPDTVSYENHVQPLFNAACAFIGCHGDDTEGVRGFSLTYYNNFMYSTNRIVYRGEPDASPLIQRVEGRIIPRMPPDQPPLNKNQTDGLRRWVLRGALNN